VERLGILDLSDTDTSQTALHLARNTAQNQSGEAVSAERLAYVAQKMTLERSVVNQFAARVADDFGVGKDADAPKVAFLFMVEKDLQQPKLWVEFFKDAPRDQFSIYIHQSSEKETEQPPQLPLSEFGAARVPWVRSSWCALFGVEVASLITAMDGDPGNVQFVFAGDSTVPFKSFEYVHKQLVVKTPKTSKFCLATAAKWLNSRDEMASSEVTEGCIFKDFLRMHNPRVMKHHQWMILSREHAATVVKRATKALEIFEEAWLKAAPDIRNAADGCSDESVPLTALLADVDLEGKSTGNTWADLARIGVELQCATFVAWRHCFQGSELSLDHGYWTNMSTYLNHPGELLTMLMSDGHFDFMKSSFKMAFNGFPHVFNEVDHSYLKRLVVNEGFMFARKFGDVVNVKSDFGQKEDILKVLPALWNEKPIGNPEERTWIHLETKGMPGPLTVP